jgi:hypothetical protein
LDDFQGDNFERIVIPATPAINPAFLPHQHLKSSSLQMPAQGMRIISTTIWNFLEDSVLARYSLLPEPVHVASAFPLGHFSSSVLRFLGSEGKVCQKFKEKAFYQRNLRYHGIAERIRLQEQKLWGIFPGQEVLKIFWIAVAKAAA